MSHAETQNKTLITWKSVDYSVHSVALWTRINPYSANEHHVVDQFYPLDKNLTGG